MFVFLIGIGAVDWFSYATPTPASVGNLLLYCKNHLGSISVSLLEVATEVGPRGIVNNNVVHVIT